MSIEKLKLEIIQMILNISDEVLLKKIIALIDKENQKS